MVSSIATINAENATKLDKELTTKHGFSIEQLMELAGLAVAQAVQKLQPRDQGGRILCLIGPGNNGGDGLVAARHLKWWGYDPIIYYPKRSNNDLSKRLVTQLEWLEVPLTEDLENEIDAANHILDAIFGFSFSGSLREPFPHVIRLLEKTSKPVTSVDIPSSWDVESGPPEGPGHSFYPKALVSLTAPKPCTRFFKGRHFLGGRGFLVGGLEEKFGLQGVTALFKGTDQIVEID